MLLREYQKQVSAWLRSPEGVAQSLAVSSGDSMSSVSTEGQSSAASSEARDQLEAIVWGDEQVSAVDRVEVYASAYFYRIHDVLSLDFPALRSHLGEVFFRDVITSYLCVRPSCHPSLRYAGAGLADFLSGHVAALNIRERAVWAADLAAFEWARGDAFDAPDRPVLTRDKVAAMAPECFLDLHLQLGPWSFLHGFEFAVDQMWRAIQSGESDQSSQAESVADEQQKNPKASLPDIFAAKPTALVIWRQNERVYHRMLGAFEERALSWLSLGRSFGELCAWIAEELSEEEAPVQAAAWLEQWLADGLLEEVAEITGCESGAES